MKVDLEFIISNSINLSSSKSNV